VVLGARWMRLRGRPDGVPKPVGGVRLAMKIAADEVFLASEVLSAALIPPRERGRVLKELRSAIRFYDANGFIASPRAYHLDPPKLEKVHIGHERAWGLEYQHLKFESGWQPHAREPGRKRWLAYTQNRTAHARLLCHPGGPRPWVVCTPGFRMGRATVDFAGFNIRWLHRGLGLNVAIPVLPFHGPRRVGRRGGDGFLTGDLLDTIHAQAQAVWDVRRLIGWLRRAGAPGVGLYGLSLGAYTAGLLTGLEEDLDCVIAGVPASDWVSLLSSHAPKALVRASERLGFPWADVRSILSVVSPLALPHRVPRERSFVFAGTVDRLAPPEQAQSLWEHWDRPRMAWYDGGHVSFMFEPSVKKFIYDALGDTGLIQRDEVHPLHRG
jgi:hypothetical protein